MHERSLVKSLLQQIDDEMQSRRLCGLEAVHLEVGDFSGVEPSLLASAFEEMSADRWRRKIQLQLDVVPLTARCRRCATEFHVERFRFLCPTCDHAGVEVIAGEEMRLVSLVADRSGYEESSFHER